MAEVLAAIRYDAFISYRRSDGGRVARWLRRQLLWYRLPRSMRERSGRRLRIYIDTTYELGAADFYEQNVKPALLSSSHLIVVATPDAVQRAVGVDDWIAREIADFAAGSKLFGRRNDRNTTFLERQR